MFSNCFSLWGTIISLRPHISQPHSDESQVSINYITLLLSTYPSYPAYTAPPAPPASAAFFYALEGENWMTEMPENWEVTDNE